MDAKSLLPCLRRAELRLVYSFVRSFVIAQGCFRDMDAIAGWGSFSNEQKQGALEDAAKRKEEHERLYSRATRLVNTATSTAASLVSKMEQRPPPKKKQEKKLPVENDRFTKTGSGQMQGSFGIELKGGVRFWMRKATSPVRNRSF